MTIRDEAIAAVERHPAVRGVRLVGSRAAGTATGLSDWDFVVDTDEFVDVAREMDALLAPLHPLAQQWDRLSAHWCWMAILEGPVKLDFIFAERHASEPPWQPTAANLTAVDLHFWDWMLWLSAKETGGKTDLVESELDKLWRYILSPMGVEARPGSLDEALTSYLTARDRLEGSLHVSVPRVLEREIRPVFRRSSGTP